MDEMTNTPVEETTEATAEAMPAETTEEAAA